MERYYLKHSKEFLDKKIILLTGPRQVGKTTHARMMKKPHEYLNFDLEEHRTILDEKSWDRKKSLLIFDELHKKENWKSWLKGIYDVEGTTPPIVVTGSAKLDTYSKVGDSLAGRYFQYRIHPLDCRELYQLKSSLSPEEILERILITGGFPEPFLDGTQRFYNLWRKTHLDIILKQDLLELENVTQIKSIELLISLLSQRVGSSISYSSLAGDLQVSDKTIKKWLIMLENMYVVFKINPFHKNIARSVLKKPKFYFYDCGRVNGDEGAKLENAVACSLLKECHFRNDCYGEEWDVHYIAKRGGLEVDFLLTNKGKPQLMIEVKNADDNPSTQLQAFNREMPDIKKLQLVRKLKREKTFPDGLEIRKAANWLAKEWPLRDPSI